VRATPKKKPATRATVPVPASAAAAHTTSNSKRREGPAKQPPKPKEETSQPTAANDGDRDRDTIDLTTSTANALSMKSVMTTNIDRQPVTLTTSTIGRTHVSSTEQLEKLAAVSQQAVPAASMTTSNMSQPKRIVVTSSNSKAAKDIDSPNNVPIETPKTPSATANKEAKHEEEGNDDDDDHDHQEYPIESKAAKKVKSSSRGSDKITAKRPAGVTKSSHRHNVNTSGTDDDDDDDESNDSQNLDVKRQLSNILQAVKEMKAARTRPVVGRPRIADTRPRPTAPAVASTKRGQWDSGSTRERNDIDDGETLTLLKRIDKLIADREKLRAITPPPVPFEHPRVPLPSPTTEESEQWLRTHAALRKAGREVEAEDSATRRGRKRASTRHGIQYDDDEDPPHFMYTQSREDDEQRVRSRKCASLPSWNRH
jgi:hypothetical protein